MPAAAAVAVVAVAGPTVGAIAGAVVTGAIAGAVVGAATAAMFGGNVLKGALKGAAIGGVTAGVLSAGSMALNSLSGGAIGSSAESQMLKLGATQSEIDKALGKTTAEAGTTLGQNTLGSTQQEGVLGSSFSKSIDAAEEAGKQKTSQGMSEGTAKILSGVGQGMATGAGDYLGKKESAAATVEGAKQLEEFKQQNAAANKATNMPGTFAAQTANITVPDWWETRINPKTIPPYYAVNPDTAQTGGPINA